MTPEEIKKLITKSITDYMRELKISGPKTNPTSLDREDLLTDDLLLSEREVLELGQKLFCVFQNCFSTPEDFAPGFGFDNQDKITVGQVIGYILSLCGYETD